MILLWGLSGDDPFDLVRVALQRRNADVFVLDQRDVLGCEIELCAGSTVSGQIVANGSVIPLKEIEAVYWRTYDVRRLSEVEAAGGGDALAAAWAFEEGMSAWLEVSDAMVVNRPSDMASNGSKPYQGEILRAYGFEIPRTLITTDPQAVRRFWTDCGAVIYKSISGARSVVSKLTPAHDARLAHVSACPTQFQQHVPGRDHRVHVVGDASFATAIVSDADDYRYAGLHGAPARLEATDLPDEVAQRCVAVARAMKLHLAGLDLRLAPDGRWFCFEVNPSPGFSYYESHTGQPIAEAIAGLLARGVPTHAVSHASRAE